MLDAFSRDFEWNCGETAFKLVTFKCYDNLPSTCYNSKHRQVISSTYRLQTDSFDIFFKNTNNVSYEEVHIQSLNIFDLYKNTMAPSDIFHIWNAYLGHQCAFLTVDTFSWSFVFVLFYRLLFKRYTVDRILYRISRAPGRTPFQQVKSILKLE